MKKLLMLFAATLLFACNKNDLIVIEQDAMAAAPEILLESTSYGLRAGQSVTIAPEYRNAAGGSYEWSIEGEVVCREASFTYTPVEAGRFYLLVAVSTQYGSDRKEIRVDVAESAAPVVTLPGADEGFEVVAGSRLELSPTLPDTGLPTTFSWQVKAPDAADYKQVATAKDYTFAERECGAYGVRFTAANEDGEYTIEFRIEVVEAADATFGWSFAHTEFNLAAGRRVRIAPQEIVNAFDAGYTWSIDGREVQQSDTPSFVFDLADEGSYKVTVVMKNSYTSAAESFTVNVCPAEGRYKRAKSAASSARWNKVFDFTAAPGQYINENYTATTAAAACAYAESRLKQQYYVSLGGFGGYIIVGFDHSIENTGGYDFAVSGNSFDTSSEPGIVWVMQDENGNGLPDDTWYELAGSEAGREMRDYAVTYYRPASASSPVPWTDNRGGRGEITRNAVHRQDYWPTWCTSNRLTLRGTCLEARNYDKSGNGTEWVQPPYDWGYADNFSSVDRLSDEANAEGNANPNHFKISNAVDFEGRSVKLEYIDFIKVQTGVNASSGHLGELSTEVCDFYDYSLAKQ